MDCILTEGRKGGTVQLQQSKWFDWGCSEDNTDNDDLQSWKAHESCERPALELEVQSSGVRRDRTSQFARMRKDVHFKRLVAQTPASQIGVPRATDDSRGEDSCEKLQRIYEEASATHTSLASKLAQHNGLRQFGAEFAHRAPPLELRMLLPHLEESIENLLQTLEGLIDQLQEVQVPATCVAVREMRSNLQSHVENILDKTSGPFEEQREHIRQLAGRSPLFSPVLCPVLNKRLAAAMGSPTLSFATTSCDDLPRMTPESPFTLPRTMADGSFSSSDTPPRDRNTKEPAPGMSPLQLEESAWDCRLEGLDEESTCSESSPRTPPTFASGGPFRSVMAVPASSYSGSPPRSPMRAANFS